MQVVPEAVAVPEAESPKGRRAGTQTSLFRQAEPPPKVIPIPTLTPLRTQERERRVRAGSRAHTLPRPRRVAKAQQALDWGEYAVQVQSRPEEKISCNAPVAPRELRIFSALVDGFSILAGAAIIAGIYLFKGGEIQFGRGALVTLAALGAVVTALYRTLWCLADGDSPGMQFAGLRLVDFDGRRPNRRQRAIRQIASLLSLCAAGVGIAWALVDDEGLTWHDHISKTFPTLQDRSRV
jgi:uncharacterized RDD family membrane protein YckC